MEFCQYEKVETLNILNSIEFTESVEFVKYDL